MAVVEVLGRVRHAKEDQASCGDGDMGLLFRNAGRIRVFRNARANGRMTEPPALGPSGPEAEPCPFRSRLEPRLLEGFL
jgi:hypothetical protein